ncbi:DNA cytosine methyltransferase [Sessilibacter corallicola]|uniref:DNA cytosine methyltransferase n=1 Tax=Sessilibacter corallicola TaxID=2904075 RepID=UPI001E330DA5|nr:DNA cytosine methyltransferase [Sessilibacter corallicola]MCE2029258.1 DNA cytosine methyltransferase [Sessilibacter corallicola]
MAAYYNEIDPFAAQWLRELIKENLIAPGEVDERDIKDVSPDDLKEFTQCHFFAGIGVWSYVLRNAGWADDRHVWTGSCPCQPFSNAGKRNGFDDERHLYPAWSKLINECKPPVIFGEQVASKTTEPWFDAVQTDLEGMGYAYGCVPFPAASVGAPHMRDRAYWMAYNNSKQPSMSEQKHSSAAVGHKFNRGSSVVCLADHQSKRRGEARKISARPKERIANGGSTSFWDDCEWIFCRDGKYRPIEPGTFPLAHRPANRVGRLRGYGNAIVAPQAQAFIEVAMEALK